MSENHPEPPHTEDLIRALRLRDMPKSTRTATIHSLRTVRDLETGGADLPVADLQRVLDTADAAYRAALGPRATQILSDVRRALRAWSDEPLRRLALRLRHREVFLSDAVAAAQLAFPADRAKRAEAAIRDLAAHLNEPPEALVATASTIEPRLQALAPEDLGVGSPTSLANKQRLIRAAVRLVDPIKVQGREADVDRLSHAWRPTLDLLLARTPEHTKAVAAIFRRLALKFDGEGKSPADVTEADLAEVIAHERRTHAPSHEDKLRAAARIWNAAIDEGLLHTSRFDRARRAPRLPDVAWQEVPAAIREPIDALLETIGDGNGGENWEDLIDDPDAVELGLPQIGGAEESDVLPIQQGTAHNWRCAVKRVWHATVVDPKLEGECKTIATLFTAANARAFVGAVWKIRKEACERQGKDWETNKKGRYETTVLQTFVSVGRALGIDEAQLSAIVAFTHKIDPAIVGTKIMPDKTVKFVFAERKIGPRHADMLRAFQENSVMRRWFLAPEQLWAEAMKGKSRRGGPTETEAALARTALVLRIIQRVCPLRRENLARLRCSGAEPNIHLPVGDGEGRLFLAAREMKNLRAVEVRIDPETVRMIKEFMRTFRPVALRREAIAKDNDHLFPGTAVERPEIGGPSAFPDGYGYHTLGKFSSTFAKHLRRKCRLNVDMQVGRHIAAKVILDMDPSAMALVQEVLGHKRLETTRSFYAEVNKMVAQKRYLQLLDKATRRALGQVDFTIFFEEQIGA